MSWKPLTQVIIQRTPPNFNLLRCRYFIQMKGRGIKNTHCFQHPVSFDFSLCDELSSIYIAPIELDQAVVKIIPFPTAKKEEETLLAARGDGRKQCFVLTGLRCDLLFLHNSFPVSFSTSSNGELNVRYALIFLRSPLFIDYANRCSYGVKMPRLGTNDGKAALVPLPPLEERMFCAVP